MLSGTRLSTSHFWVMSWNLLNTGKAVTTASTTVIMGTSAIVVVNVRLPAVTPRRSCAKRSRSVAKASRQRRCHRSPNQACNLSILCIVG